MRNSIIKIMMILLLMLVFGTGPVLASPITLGDNGVATGISLLQSTTGAANGDFLVYQDSALIPGFTTFCLENDVHFSPGTKYSYSATIDDEVFRSKVKGGNRGLYGGTKYLYWNFINGTLDGWETNQDNVTALQNAIWKLQYDFREYGLDVTLDTVAQVFYNTAVSNATAGESLNVKVMNLWSGTPYKGGYVQSQLIIPAPEPGTLLLLGSGLVGLALYRRKAKQQ